MTVKIPQFKEPGLSEFITRLIEDRDRTTREKLDKVRANTSVLLYSPSKKVYEVTVSDAGALVVTLVAG